MIRLTSFIFLAALVGVSKADYCQNNFTLGEFPEGILEEAISIITTGTINDFQGCPGNNTVSPNDVKFWFNNRSISDIPLLLDSSNPVLLDPSKPTKILIHGWLCNVTNDRMPQLKDAYLARYDCNVIRVDWSALPIALYTASFCSVPGVAEIIGAFICTLNSKLNVSMDDVHVVGHSMGGQVSGLAGQQVQSQCSLSIGRITGLDPAGPLYQTLPPIQRLDASDAQLVDVIHTNQGGLGFYGPCGQVDYFPNCGTFQPGCMQIDNDTSVESIINEPISEISCNHLRSCDYMIESINPPSRKRFKGTSCSGCPLPCGKDLFLPKKNLMGEDCTFPSPKPKFYLKTKSKSPFARG